MRRPMLIPMLVLLIQFGHGGVAGVATGVVDAAGGDLPLIGTRGGKTTKLTF
jgi:hypothetical protein